MDNKEIQMIPHDETNSIPHDSTPTKKMETTIEIEYDYYGHHHDEVQD